MTNGGQIDVKPQNLAHISAKSEAQISNLLCRERAFIYPNLESKLCSGELISVNADLSAL